MRLRARAFVPRAALPRAFSVRAPTGRMRSRMRGRRSAVPLTRYRQERR
ncbi:hypothetical protein BURMUCGD2M_4577 [Burkholderia multivorans CGD2M]|nr:hypothetical protein BURMUCGD2M_4577 [Burkholderia multivorans CGD2M]